MSVTPLPLGFSMLAFNLMMEYGTLTKRRGLVIHIVARGIATVFAFGILWLWDSVGLDRFSYLRQCVSTVFYYLSCLYLFKESFAQKTFLYFMDFSATSFVASLSSWIALRLPFGESPRKVKTILFIAILVLLLPLYFRFLRNRVREMLFLFKQSKPFYAAFPFLSFLFFAVSFGPVNTPDSLTWFMKMLLYVSLVVLTYYLLFSHFYVVYDRLKTEGELTQAEQRLHLQKKYYEEVDKSIETQQKLLHDTRHHLLAMATLAKAGDASAVDQYIERFLASYDSPGPRRYCRNTVINAILGGYAKVAEEGNIAVSVDIDFPEENIGIDEYELCILMGNIFENAIEACQRIPPASELYGGRFISIKARTENRRLVVRLENSFQGDPGTESVDLRSSKGSGIGLKSVRKVVDRYEGSMSCDRRENVFIFSAVLCLKS